MGIGYFSGKVARVSVTGLPDPSRPSCPSHRGTAAQAVHFSSPFITRVPSACPLPLRISSLSLWSHISVCLIISPMTSVLHLSSCPRASLGVWPWHTCGGLVCRSGPSWASSEIGVTAGRSCSSVPIRISANPLSQSRLIVLVFLLLFPLGVSLQPMLVYVGGRFLVQLLTSYQCW